MLVLSRHKDEAILVNRDIKIVVVDIRGDKVRLGVEAPRAVPVHREEVYKAICRDQNAAGNETVPVGEAGLSELQKAQARIAKLVELSQSVSKDLIELSQRMQASGRATEGNDLHRQIARLRNAASV